MLTLIYVTFLFALAVARPWTEMDDGDSVLFNDGMYQGDIAGIDPTDRNAIVNAADLWTDGVIYYQIRSNNFYSEFYDNITEAMRIITEKTGRCITFKNGKRSDGRHLDIHLGNGCWSMVGMQKQAQLLSLGHGCQYVPLIVHELMHAIGFYHEQNRSDRDDYLYIQLENVYESMRYNFNKLQPSQNYLLVPYDYRSVLQYGEYAFSSNKKRTIVPKQEGVEIVPVWVRHYDLTNYDVTAIKKLYQCDGYVRPTPAPPTDVSCTFTDGWCIFRNAPTFEMKFERVSEDGNWFLETDISKYNGEFSRLISNFVQLNGAYDGCLSFDYKYSGNGGIDLVALYSYDKSQHKVWRLKELSDTNGWKTVQRNVRHNQDVRFALDVARVPGVRVGKIAFDNFKYYYQAC